MNFELALVESQPYARAAHSIRAGQVLYSCWGTTGRRYRIIAARQMNVAALDKHGRWAKSLCFIPSGQLPLGDIMLAQKIALELFEREALSIANRDRVGSY